MIYENYSLDELKQIQRKRNEESFNYSLKTNGIKHFTTYKNRYDKNVIGGNYGIEIIFTNKETKQETRFYVKEKDIAFMPF